jgi:alkanesulfonate monooxygenase SsuD/methylene tetrahydromethanopterin reductase-like flavin-dependent oxidoreductase (luciferase family)
MAVDESDLALFVPASVEYLVRLGAALPLATIGGGPLGSRSLATSAQFLEELGYSSLWVFDAIGRGFMLPDPLMALAVAATVTSGVELGSGVIQLPLRNTVDLAYRALTLHHIAGGRFLFGVGPGSTRSDFATLGADYDARFRVFSEQLPRLRSLLATGTDGEVALYPWEAAAGGPPLFVGAWRSGWVERAATTADGWIASAAHNDDATLEVAIQRFRNAGGTRAVVTNVQIGPDVTPTIERLHHLRSMGFDDGVVLDLTPTAGRYAALREAFT